MPTRRKTVGKYASATSVSTEKSRGEIERTIMRYGADQFIYGWETDRSIIGFRYKKRMIRFELLLPNRSDYDTTPTGRYRSQNAQEKHYEQAQRQRWRALVLCIKAKLAAVEAGCTTFED